MLYLYISNAEKQYICSSLYKDAATENFISIISISSFSLMKLLIDSSRSFSCDSSNTLIFILSPIILYVLVIDYFVNSSSILNNWLYLHTLSVLDIEPVFICPKSSPTAKSAIVVSSVSPERCEMMVL